MALGINTNVASLNAQNQLSKSQGQNDQALERLSSGLRINSAKDDAAGLAISTRFESQITGLETASRNANDGISLAQTAEGALDEITNNLQRVRELSVQSANATNNSSDRAALNDEVQQRLEEIDRIAAETGFNGLNVLDGSLESQEFQVGANRGQTIGVDLSQGSRADQIGKVAEAELNVDSDNLGNDFDLSVGDSTKTISVDDDGSAASISEAVRAEGFEGVSSVEATNVQEFATDDATLEDAEGDSYTLSVDIGNGDVTEDVTIETDGDDVDLTADRVADAVNSNTALSDAGFTASLNDDGNVEFAQEDGRNFNLDQTLTQANSDDDGLLYDDSDDGTLDAAVANVDFSGSVDVIATETVEVADGDGDAAVVGGEQSVEPAGAIEDIDISDVPGANDAITRVDSALETINGTRSQLGAIQNRFESTIANLDNNTENLEASNSRIKDADFASESAKLSQSQVLQQAGISVLSQANQRPQQVLSLLQ